MNFNDNSTECGICLNPLDAEETITLSCGHMWHLQCIQQQLENAQPSKSKRLVFTGCTCPICRKVCEHPKLENLTRRTDTLRTQVDAMIVEQSKIDSPEVWRDADDVVKRQLINDGHRTYAFYLCGGCDNPYFGGTIECADYEDEGELNTSEDRLCPSCSQKAQVICTNLEHRPFHVWKCRYCCRPSSFVCYGNTHFCKGCHDRNSERVRNGNKQALEGLPCIGETCPYPKANGCNKHSNGSDLSCEQVYYCAACESSPSSHAIVERPGSRNFIMNHSGEEGGIRFWQPNSQSRWVVEDMEVRVDESTMSNFVSNHTTCVMSQTVPLYMYVNDPSLVTVEVSAKFMGRTDCPSVFKLDAIVINSQGRIIHRSSTSTMQSPADFWEKTSLMIDPIADAHQIVMVVCGRDGRFWQGNYGSKVCHCSVRVLGTDVELQNILLPG